jgi:hypothetical protein
VIDTIAVTLILGALLYLQDRRFAADSKEWALERGALLQRIQAPEQAVVTAAIQDAPLTLPVPFDDDDEAIAAMEARSEAA